MAKKKQAEGRKILVAGDINAEAYSALAVMLGQLNETEGPITIQFCSDGGIVEPGFAMFDLMIQSPNEITTEAYGTVASMATLLFLAGDHRRVSENCRLMVHSIHIELEGGTLDRKTMRHTEKELEVLDKRYQDLVAVRCGQPIKEVKKWFPDETWFSPEEAIDFGLADEIIRMHPRRKALWTPKQS